MIDEEGINKQAYIKYLISHINCPVCNRSYTPDNIQILGHKVKEEVWLMTTFCPECSTQGLVIAIIKDKSEFKEISTDLTPQELARFEQKGPITTNDVLDLHEFLRDYRGDMAELINW